MHVLTERNSPSMNVHSGDPVVEEEVVYSNPFNLRASCWRNDHLYWTHMLELPRLNPQSATTEFTGKSGDVLLVAMPDHLIFHYLIRRWHTNPATTDYVHCRTPLPRAVTMLTSEPFVFILSTCFAEHAPHSHVLDTSSHPMTWSV